MSEQSSELTCGNDNHKYEQKYMTLFNKNVWNVITSSKISRECKKKKQNKKEKDLLFELELAKVKRNHIP